MPYVLLVIGAVLFIAGIRGTHTQLWELVKGDFFGTTGQSNFIIWIAAIAIVGAMGYIPKLKPLSVAFIALLLISLLLRNKGVIDQLKAFVQKPSGNVDIKPNSNAPVMPLAPIQPFTQPTLQ